MSMRPKNHPLAATVLALAGGLFCPPSQAQAQGWQVQLHTDRHSDALPIRDIEDEVYARLRPRSGRNLAYIDDEVRASRRDGDWTWSLLARNRATLVLNQDAVELFAQVKKVTPGDRDRQWNVQARLRGFSGAGAAVEKRFALASDWTARLGAQGLVLSRWRDRRIDGPVQYDAATRGYTFDLRSQETSNRLEYPFQQDFASSGAALLLNAEIAWQGEAFDGALSVRDLGWLHWRGIPHQSASLSTSTQAYDSDGFLIYEPLVQGRNSQSRRTESAPHTWTLRGGWRPASAHRIELATDVLPGFGLLPRTAWEYRHGDWSTALGWRFHERRLTLGLGWRGWRLQAGTDRFGNARSQGLGLSWQTAM